MAINARRKRYQLSLTPAIVDRFQGLCKKLNMPTGTMSNAVDDLLDNISDTFQLAIDKGTIELSDLMKVMGKQMELIETEERERKNVSKQKPDSVPHTEKHV